MSETKSSPQSIAKRANPYVRRLLLALAGIVVGMMSVSLLFDLAIYLSPDSKEAEQNATQYYLLVRTSFVPLIVEATLITFVIAIVYRVVFIRNWRTALLAIGILGLSVYYVGVVFALEDNLPNLTDFDERIDSLLQIGWAHFLTWLAGWGTMVLLIPETSEPALEADA